MDSDPKNCVRTSEKYWLFSLVDLVTHLRILPSEQMSLGAKLNSLMRLSLLVFAIMLFTEYSLAIPFFILSVAVNVVAYFLLRKNYE